MHLSNLVSSSLFIFGVACVPIEQEASISVSLGNLLSNICRDTGRLPNCNIADTPLPTPGNGPGLPAPAANLKLKYTALGVGTQNYTCASSDDSTSPALLGAVATLYDASCLVTKFATVLDSFAQIAVKLPTNVVNDMITKHLDLEILGNHYFAGHVPTFDLRRNSRTDFVAVSVVAKVPAPGSGDVDWLKLDRVDGSGIETVYRVKTTGGKAPATCKSMPRQFEVKYIAQYWMYG
ncbi:hypothetical protein PRK78_004311 [Emydomyces testavorans]|uniref:Malate dehydrogenase n=1 Tax=Emydomyces testavorans TaxID=2070801 RepID=A0AAF0IJ54_9EURO|nr:hypothetical protein PRK78_004311 [Emydomyces testavorans]